MDNEYNDYQIISPSDMQEVAKKYYQKLSEINNKKNEENKNKLTEINNYLSKINNNIFLLKKFCNARNLKEKLNIVNLIENEFIKIKNNFNFQVIKSDKNPKNYCSAITSCINDLSCVINLCLNFNCINIEEKNNMNNCIINCLILIKYFSNLIGECRYRNWF